jgi:purine nucleoside phosphorylase
MTGAHEATLACELNVPYAMLCIVDNMANGLADEKVRTLSFLFDQHYRINRA